MAAHRRLVSNKVPSGCVLVPRPTMVVMGAPKVIFIPSSQAEQECTSLASVMLPVHSPEPAGSDGPQRKRQRLTHLSPEEKALRRKLKNRVAAQTARDRKKARMGELEQQVLDLELENEKLLIENKLLREKSHGLITENQELRQRLGLEALEVKEEDEVESDILLGLLESLESEILLGYEGELPYQQQEAEGSEADSIPTAPSSPLGAPSIKLEAINELIRFDHVYTKPVCSEQDLEQEVESSVDIKTEEAPISPSCIEPPICVKQECQEEELVPAIGLLSCPEYIQKPANLLDAGSDSGYEGGSSPFSDMSSPLNSDQTWEDTFTSELFPQLLDVHMDQTCAPSPLSDPTLFWNPSPTFDDEPF